MSFSSNEYNKFSTASLITRSTNDAAGTDGDDADVPDCAVRSYPGNWRCYPGIPDRFFHDMDPWCCCCSDHAGAFLLFQVAMPKFTKLQTLIDRLNLVTRDSYRYSGDPCLQS